MLVASFDGTLSGKTSLPGPKANTPGPAARQTRARWHGGTGFPVASLISLRLFHAAPRRKVTGAVAFSLTLKTPSSITQTPKASSVVPLFFFWPGFLRIAFGLPFSAHFLYFFLPRQSRLLTSSFPWHVSCVTQSGGTRGKGGRLSKYYRDLFHFLPGSPLFSVALDAVPFAPH